MTRPARRPLPARTTRARLAALVLAVAYLASAVLGGTVFVWCAPMAAAMLHACCPAEARHGPVVEQPCCEGHRVAALPDLSAGAAPDAWIAPAPLVAVLALAILYAVSGIAARPPQRLRAHPARAGPRVPLFLRHRSLRN